MENNEPAGNGGFMSPVRKIKPADFKYDIYPSFQIEEGKIFSGFDALAARLKSHRIIIIDGYNGVFFNIVREKLSNILHGEGYKTSWTSTYDLLRPQSEIIDITREFLGGDDPLFGKRTTLTLNEFFATGMLRSAHPDPSADFNFIIGPGAALAGWDGLMVYLDVPKDEIQRRSRQGLMTNLGICASSGSMEMYKTFYFVDWVVQNRHKKKLLPSVDVFADMQHPELPVWMEGDTLRRSLAEMSRNSFRAKPWFEAGAWGGTWIKDNIEAVNKKAVNYAWSFELISPENGLLIESSSLLCEISFDCLMYQEAKAVLGESYGRFGTDFPIRFDFLDTFNGGNLSLQCHPQPVYMKEHFGEDFTQEEAYYILDTKDNASVYLGFRDDIVPQTFRKALEDSYSSGETINPEEFILRHPAKKHDFFLIPPGTIHGSGKDNLVLEISSTPYIFTFKMYDWQRPGFDGKPRPLNIARGMENLRFERKGPYVRDHLICQPVLIDEGSDWKVWHLPTHEDQLYDVKRYEFYSEIEIRACNRCLVMSLAGGKAVEVRTRSGRTSKYCYAETFVIPAAAGDVRIKNTSGTKTILISAFVK
jgi:mannose-6-phosphate isomerase class I